MTGWRTATPYDTPGITRVINHYIAHGWAAYNETAVTERWAVRHLDRSLVSYVLEDDDDIRGYASLNPFRDGEAFMHTATVTYFLLPESAGQGRGTQILTRLENDAKSKGIEQLLAHISSENKQSLAFHDRRGFIECGRFKSVGRKWDRYFDLVWMQKTLDTSNSID